MTNKPDWNKTDKEYWEVEQLKAQVRTALKPYLSRPASWITIFIAIAGISSSIFQWFSYERDLQLAQIKKAEAERAIQDAEKRKGEIQQEIEMITADLEIAQAQLEKAEKQFNELNAELSSLPSKEELNRIQSKQTVEDGKILKSLATDIESLRSRSNEAHKALVHDGTKARLFFFTRNKFQQEKIYELENQLNSMGLFVSNIITSRYKAPMFTEIRYFREQDRDEALRIQKILQEKFQGKRLKAVFIDDPNSIGEGRKYQIWLAEDAFIE